MDEEESSQPVFVWHPTYEPIVDAYVQTKWQETIFLSIERGGESESGDTSGSTAEPLPYVIKYRWEWEGDTLEGVEITSDRDGVYLNAYDVSADIFPAEDIEYQLHGGDKPPYRTTHHTDRFSNIPHDENLAEIIRYIPNPKTTKSFVLMVTAELSNRQEMSAGFTIVIWTDYSIGKKSLQEAIRASHR